MTCYWLQVPRRFCIVVCLGSWLGSGLPARAEEGPAAPLPSPTLATETLVQRPERQPESLPAPGPVVRPRWELVVAGVGLLASVWIADRMLTKDSINGPYPWLPLAGPWYQVSQRAGQPAQDLNLTLLVIDGSLQLAGLGVAIAGLSLRQRHLGIQLPRRAPRREAAPADLP